MAFHVFRIYRLLMAVFLLFGALVVRLFYLQIIDGPLLTAQSVGMRVQEVPVEVARGEILDRNGQPLTNTAQHFSVVVFPEQIVSVSQTAAQLAVVTGLPRENILEQLAQAGYPFKMKTDLDAVTAQKINGLHLPGVLCVAEKKRYGSSALAAHIVGYINQADNKGVSGIEGMYDEILRGNQPEYVAAVVDAGQRLIPGLGYKRIRLNNGAAPSNVVLTIDSRIQKIVEGVMDRHVPKGAVVILRPSTGEILACASRPNFDANNLGDYLQHVTAPLLNRALAAYQPGSVFKLVVAAAALESGAVRPQDIFYDQGYIDVGSLRFKGWDYERGPRGRLTFTDAIAYSSNPVLIEVALRLGPAKVIEYAHKLGFGQHTGLNFESEADGNLPAADALYPGDLANLAIGQGLLEATPLQVASLVATIVNDGVKVEPYIVSKFTSPEGVVIKQFPVSRGVRVLSRATAAELRAMMLAVTRYGTGQAAYVDGIGSAGKTGSAETGRTDGKGKGINHAWFAGYAPLENPQYVVVVFVEEGMSGGDVAAPVFREIVAEIYANTNGNSVNAR
ncbi:Peptidoglycan glycosyltransferase [Thermosinus carboxydivorans Nor1]|uniref:Peptidoglycan glycosyltransferase n=1 Tax=Thermosinus carboxydivorans Nor1 TaxID=401526 RepID=A1HQ86_9FIRM|nr:penicillin-binding protein 2 [Thermosinus carboxydivorans]EAX47933.1 Peptidoglycan glycosyltransferase [Thermosinus carboxydivorans Nor1]